MGCRVQRGTFSRDSGRAVWRAFQYGHVRSSRVGRFTLVTLGRLTLLTPSGDPSESLSRRRLKLAVLAVLATARRPLPRGALTEMFWGDQEESRARHSLSDALSHLRRELGRRAIVSHGNEISLSPDAPLVIDAVAFEGAVEARDFSRASELYTGPFLDGVDIDASPSFDQWVSRERRRLESMFFQVCTQHCLTLARAREWEQCGALASRWLDEAPLSVDAALYRLNAVKAAGTREGAYRALDDYDALARRLAREFDLAPERPVRDLAESLRASVHTLPSEPALVVASPAKRQPETAREVDQAARTPAPNVTALATSSAASAVGRRISRGVRRYLARAATAVAVIVALGGAIAAGGRTEETTIASRPRVVIAVDEPPGDPWSARLADRLPQMISAELSRSPELDVIPPSQVRALLQRRGGGAAVAAELEDARALARRIGAMLVVVGTVSHDGRTLVLNLAIRDALTGRVLENDELTRRDAGTLAIAAAARVLGAMRAQRERFDIAGLERVATTP